MAIGYANAGRRIGPILHLAYVRRARPEGQWRASQRHFQVQHSLGLELDYSDRFAAMLKWTCSVEPIALLESIGSYARLRRQTFRFALPFRFRSFRQA